MRALLVATVMLLSSSFAANALLINFVEGDAGTTVSTDAGPCPLPGAPCLQGITPGAETASIDLIVPANFFAAPNAPPNGPATAFLLEQDNSKVISDIVTLLFVAAENRLSISLTSDAEDGSFGAVPAGFFLGSNENGSSIDVTFNFFTGTKDNPMPYRGLPSGTTIRVLSDLDFPIPEPTAMVIFGTALVGLAVFGRKKRKSG